MGILFSKTKPSRSSSAPSMDGRVTDVDRHILQLKVQKDTLVGYRRRLIVQVDADTAAATDFIAKGRKDYAIYALKKRKLHQGQLEETETHLLKVEEIVGSVESALLQKEVVEALAAGAAAVKGIQQELSADYVQSLLDTLEEGREHVQDIDDLLSAQNMDGLGADDAHLVDELNALMMAEPEIEAQVVVDELPPVPTHPITTSTAHDATLGVDASQTHGKTTTTTPTATAGKMREQQAAEPEAEAA